MGGDADGDGDTGTDGDTDTGPDGDRGAGREDEGDPNSIRTIAVAREDVLDAFEYTRSNPGTAVLRLTPPFHGRMRARLHVYRDAGETAAIHVPAADLLADDAVAAYPTLEDVESHLDTPNDAEHGDDDAPATERLREALADERDSWRERARESIVDELVLETADGAHRVDVTALG